MNRIAYKVFTNMPSKLESVPEFYSIYFNLEAINVNEYLNIFLKTPEEFTNKGLKGVEKVLQDFAGIKKFWQNAKELNSADKIAHEMFVLHKLFVSWRVNGIYEFITDCPPDKFNLESLVPQDRLNELQSIKLKLSAEYQNKHEKIYALIEMVMTSIRDSVIKDPKLVKDNYRSEITNILSFTNFYEIMQNSVLQLLYKSPGIQRFAENITQSFLKLVSEGDITTNEYKLFDRNISGSQINLKGRGASAGKVKAQVKICTDFNELKKIKSKDFILICPKTSPQWTPYFNKLKGIITESGGILSHAAIIAREMQIPCIVGVKDILNSLKDGELIEMDGKSGQIIK